MDDLQVQLEQALAYRDGDAGRRDLAYANRRLRAIRLAIARDLATHTDEQWWALVAEMGWRCVRCGTDVSTGALRKDHIVPIYRGGSDGIDNVQPLCVTCNCAKGPDDTNWVVYRRLYGFDGDCVDAPPAIPELIDDPGEAAWRWPEDADEPVDRDEPLTPRCGEYEHWKASWLGEHLDASANDIEQALRDIAVGVGL
jgi:hypothetical protein